jgi:Ca2+-binding EF-hand superfamily protein
MLSASHLRHIGLAGLIMTAMGFLVARLAVPSLAQQPQSSPAPEVVMSPGYQLLLSRLRVGQTAQSYLELLRVEFFQIDADSDGKITQRDIDLHGLMEAIQARSLGVTMVMRYDLDGDGFVIEEEVRRATRYEQRVQRAHAAIRPPGNGPSPLEFLDKQIDNNVQSIMALDTDKDGKVSLAEAGKFSFGGAQRVMAQNALSARARQALTLDGTSKGEVSQVDFEAAGQALLHKVDADHDDKISQQELADYRSQPGAPDAAMLNAATDATQARLKAEAELARKNEEAAKAAKAACEMLAPSQGAKVIFLSGYETDALSSATLGSQDAVIHAGRVNVEAGAEPLYVVISTYSPTIWQFGGAIERIERLVLSSSRSGPDSSDPKQLALVGAAGIPAKRISFVRTNCIGYFTDAPTSGSLQAVANVRSKVGKTPDIAAAKYSVGTYSVPSGKIETMRDPRQGPLIIQKNAGTLNIVGNPSNVVIQAGPSRARDEMARFFPGGVTEIDPKTVVANVPVARYEVLPAQAGLVQLLATGVLTQNSAGEYLVAKKIRFPAGLTGAHAVTFLVLKGAPYPDGDPGHSCVMVEEGSSKGATCRQ